VRLAATVKYWRAALRARALGFRRARSAADEYVSSARQFDVHEAFALRVDELVSFVVVVRIASGGAAVTTAQLLPKRRALLRIHPAKVEILTRSIVLRSLMSNGTDGTS